MNPASRWISAHPATAYFVLTFAISWGGVLVAIGGPGGLTGIKAQDNPGFPFAVVAMVLGPSLTGIGLTALIDGRRGLAALGSRLVAWRLNARWYAIALLGAPMAAALAATALSRFSPAVLPGIVVARDKAAVLTLALAVGVTAGIFEELGWTGFAIPRMLVRYSVLRVGLTVGLLWSAWHVLVIAWGIGDRAGALPLPVFILLDGLSGLPAFRVLMVWTYDRTESLLLAVLMHASLTTTVLTLTPEATGTSLLAYGLMFAGAIWIAFAVMALRVPHAPRATPVQARRLG